MLITVTIIYLRPNKTYLINKFNYMQVNNIMSQLAARHQGESEFLQAVREVLDSIEEVYNQHPEFEKAGIV